MTQFTSFPVDRVNASRAMAKCIAYLACGKMADARKWFIQLARELGMRDLLTTEHP